MDEDDSFLEFLREIEETLCIHLFIGSESCFPVLAFTPCGQ